MIKNGWSLYTRTVLLGVGPALLLALILSGYFIHARIQDVHQELDNKGQLIAVQLAATSDYFVLTGNNSIVEPLARVLLEDPDVEFIEIGDISGDQLFSQGGDRVALLTGQEQEALRSELQWYQADIIQYDVLQDDDDDWFGQSGVEKVLGQVRVGLSDNVVHQRQAEILFQATLIALVGMILSGLIAWLSGARLVRPITELSETVNRMREGNYGVRTPENASGEVGTLQQGVNTLSSALQKSEEIQQHYVESLIKAREASEAANKAKSEFLAVMTHELRTPMNGVLGMLQLMQTTDLSEEQNEYVETALSSGDHLLGLINDILDFSKIEQGSLELESRYFNLYESLFRLGESFKVGVQSKGLEFRLNIDPVSQLEVQTDETRLRQVLVNLLGNAVKFTDQGFVELSVHGLELEGNHVDLEIRVSDSGKGISKGNLARIFDAFQQEDASISRQYGGTGLGLAISRQLISQMGGVLDVESEKDHGSTFICRFNFKFRSLNGSARFVEPAVEQSESYDATILLVEDNDVNQKVAQRMLQHFGIRCDVAVDGRQAINLSDSRRYDLILMDLQMPNVDGYEATSVIRNGQSSNVKTPIIALTANAFSDVKGQCLKVGMDDFLAKPYKKESLHDLLGKWIGERRH